MKQFSKMNNWYSCIRRSIGIVIVLTYNPRARYELSYYLVITVTGLDQFCSLGIIIYLL